MKLLCFTCYELTQNIAATFTLSSPTARSTLKHASLSLLHPSKGFVNSNKHITAQQHFKKSFTLQEGMLRAVDIPLDLWISSSVFLYLNFFQDIGNITPRKSEFLCSTLYSVLSVDWVQCSQGTRALKPCFLLPNYILQTKDEPA